jgi:hypothetical protein
MTIYDDAACSGFSCSVDDPVTFRTSMAVSIVVVSVTAVRLSVTAHHSGRRFGVRPCGFWLWFARGPTSPVESICGIQFRLAILYISLFPRECECFFKSSTK